jgi:N-dimethylarginine dimethylaminohydrolase
MRKGVNNYSIGPIYTVNTGFLEGGDYILHNNISYIMDGPRTDKRAIDELICRDLFGTPTIVVIYDNMPDTDMHRIHLDTILNFLDQTTVVVWKGALHGKHKKYVRVLDMHGNEQEEPSSLRDYLIKHSFDIVEVSTKEQMEYKCNFVYVPNLGILSQAPVLARDAATPPTVIEFGEINKLYGGLRCSIKVI